MAVFPIAFTEDEQPVVNGERDSHSEAHDHLDTLRTMNNLAAFYINLGQAADALVLLPQVLESRQRRVQAEPTNNIEQAYLAWTHGQIGEAEQLRHDYAAAVLAYGMSVEMFDKLDQAGVLKDPFFRGRMNLYRQRLALCRKAEQAVKDVDFALKQQATEVPGLLDIRVRALLKEQKLPAAVESAAKMKELAGDDPSRLYDAAYAYALCAAAKTTIVDASGSDKLAAEAMGLLKQAVAKGYKDIEHLKKDDDLKALHEREDYKRLLKELENSVPSAKP